jgi:hypothetical protein
MDAIQPQTNSKIESYSPPNGEGSYEDFVSLFSDFHAWRNAQPSEQSIIYSPAWTKTRQTELRNFQNRLPNYSVAQWDRHKQVDYLAVRAQMDLEEFTLNITKPWARDPGLYIDTIQKLAYTNLPLPIGTESAFKQQIQNIPNYLSQAKINLNSVAGDYADLAIHSLSNGDGVGHGMPYRAVEPPGLIGWFSDLHERAKAHQPDLLTDIEAAQESILDYRDWLESHRPTFSRDAGVGKPAYDWFLRNVRLMPYNSDQTVLLAERELERFWANYTTERHRNRNLPEIALPTSGAEYENQLAGTDAKIRKWLQEEEIITIPDYIPESYIELGYNAPWIVRPDGPMFWEQIQFRDASPDHLHATIPGHRFDKLIEGRLTSPIRSKIRDSGRTEGWAFYLEETALQLGLFDDRPRTREFIYIFGVFRAARTIGDVKMQRNEMTVQEAMRFWIDWTPFLDENVAREDAGIYIRRPPGYGTSYLMGSMQLQKLLSDRKRQLGDDFSLKDFHDYLMNTGRLPVSLIRYDLTGYDDEIQRLWKHDPLTTIHSK